MGMHSNTSQDFDQLLARLGARARRLSETASEADDLVQETVLSLIRMQHDGATINDKERYSMTVLRNHARQHWRKTRPTEPLNEEMAAAPESGPARLACADIAAAIERLPSAQADLMRLVAAGETSPAALARLTKVPQGTVMSRLARARARLRIEMGMPEQAPVADLL